MFGAGDAVGLWVRSDRSSIPLSYLQPWDEVNIQGMDPALQQSAGWYWQLWAGGLCLRGGGSALLPCMEWVNSLSAFPRRAQDQLMQDGELPLSQLPP